MIRRVHVEADGVADLVDELWVIRWLTSRSRDNLPNPKQDGENLYVPRNMPAIGDLFDLFDFDGGD